MTARSRRYPIFDLRAAVESGRRIWAGRERTGSVTRDDAAQVLGHKGASQGGPASRKIAAILYYGVIEERTRGYLHLTWNGAALLHEDEASAEWRRAAKEAFLSPEIFREIIERWREASKHRGGLAAFVSDRLGIEVSKGPAVANIFLASAEYAGLLQEVLLGHPLLNDVGSEPTAAGGADGGAGVSDPSERRASREDDGVSSGQYTTADGAPRPPPAEHSGAQSPCLPSARISKDDYHVICDGSGSDEVSNMRLAIGVFAGSLGSLLPLFLYIFSFETPPAFIWIITILSIIVCSSGVVSLTLSIQARNRKRSNSYQAVTRRIESDLGIKRDRIGRPIHGGAAVLDSAKIAVTVVPASLFGRLLGTAAKQARKARHLTVRLLNETTLSQGIKVIEIESRRWVPSAGSALRRARDQAVQRGARFFLGVVLEPAPEGMMLHLRIEDLNEDEITIWVFEKYLNHFADGSGNPVQPAADAVLLAQTQTKRERSEREAHPGVAQGRQSGAEKIN